MYRWVKPIFLFFCAAFTFFLGMQFASDGRFVKKAMGIFHSPQPEPLFAVTEHKPFVIVVPSYNNSSWVEKNLRSIFEQKYDNYRVVYINDASTIQHYYKLKN